MAKVRRVALWFTIMLLGLAASAAADGIWISRQAVSELPMTGPAWEALAAAADTDPGTPDLSDQDQMNNVHVLAKALVYARTGNESYRDEVRANCLAAIDTELGGRTLALGRELLAYVAAADLVGLEADEDLLFRGWLERTLTEVLDGRTLRSTHEDRPNNWGTHAGASRAAVAVYLGDEAELARTAQVFFGWLGDRDAYAGFSYGTDLSWQADPAAPVGINPLGAEKAGELIDGAQPEEMRRGCPFQYPPCPTGYAWEALQGALAQAEILFRQGYDSYRREDNALLRAVGYLGALDERYGSWWAEGDDTWQPWLVNLRYRTDLTTVSPSRPGKNTGWTDWTHDPVHRSTATEQPTVYRGAVASLAPGWKAALPPGPSNDDETAPFPLVTTLPRTAADTIVSGAKLSLYRLLLADGVPAGNRLRASKTPLGVELSY